MSDKTSDSAKRIADELASCGVKLVASLPDNWLMDVIKTDRTATSASSTSRSIARNPRSGCARAPTWARWDRPR